MQNSVKLEDYRSKWANHDKVYAADLERQLGQFLEQEKFVQKLNSKVEEIKHDVFWQGSKID